MNVYKVLKPFHGPMIGNANAGDNFFCEPEKAQRLIDLGFIEPQKETKPAKAKLETKPNKAELDTKNDAATSDTKKRTAKRASKPRTSKGASES